VQAKLAAQARARRCRLRGSPAILSGRLFDDHGNRMTPTHANKGGARYRYYISQAVLQKKSQAPGSVSRVPAAELETLVLAALRHHLNVNGTGGQSPGSDRDLVERQLERVILTSNEIKRRGGAARALYSRCCKRLVRASHRGREDDRGPLEEPGAGHR
jgi:site-specific DNA recombinase